MHRTCLAHIDTIFSKKFLDDSFSVQDTLSQNSFLITLLAFVQLRKHKQPMEVYVLEFLN